MKTALPFPLTRLLLAALLLLSACSSFDQKWKQAGADGATRWEGRWTSEKHLAADGRGEGGRLRCVLERTGPRELLAHFHANWSVFSSDYAVQLSAKKAAAGKRTAAPVEFQGTHELPKIFGGTYRYDARIAGDRFTARYDSSYDRGTFAMRCVDGCKDCLPPLRAGLTARAAIP